MTVYTAFAALRDDPGNPGTGGVWASTDFTVTGAQPTWTQINTGLAATDVRVFRVDPFDPIGRQFCQLQNAEEEIYRRTGGAWSVILDLTTAKALVGDYWSAPNESNTSLAWVAPDPTVQGRVYALLSNFSLGGANTHSTWILRSDDYGDNWTFFAIGLTLKRGAQTVEARGASLWVGACDPLVAAMRVAHSADGGGTWTKSASIGSATQAYHAILIRPDAPDSAYLIRYSTSAGSRDLIRADYAAGIITINVLQDGSDLGTSFQNKGVNVFAIDQLWIDPADNDHQRIQSAGNLYVTTDGWATVDSTTAIAGITNASAINDLITPSDTTTPVIVSHYAGDTGRVLSLTNETDGTPENRSGTNWNTPPYTDAVPSDAGAFAYNGLWVGRESTDGIYVYAVEMGDVGTEHGVPLHGDRGAWDDEGYPQEHAQDIALSTPHWHAPYPGAAGQVVRSDGGKWQSSTLSLADMGVTPADILNQSQYKPAVRVATTTALPTNTLSGNTLTATGNGALPSIDGVSLSIDDRLLVKNEAASHLKHGIYTVTDLGDGGSPWILDRAEDANSDAEVMSGLTVWVSEGTALLDTCWVLTTDDTIVLNTTALTFAEHPFTGLGSPAELSDSAAAAGTGTMAARADHDHQKALNFRKNSAGSVYTRPRLNVIEGSNITVTMADDGSEVDLTIAASAGGGIGAPLTVTEEDNSPSVANVTEIRVSNSTLTDNGGGSVSITTGGGSGASVALAYFLATTL